MNGPLRLAYQSFGQVKGMGPYQDRLMAMVEAAAGDAEVRLLRLSSTLVSGKGFASAQALDIPAILRSVAAAVDDGVEAVAIGNGFDPGLWEARELFDVPVVGMFESVSAHALRVGWKVGVLCSGASGVPRVEELVARYGIVSRFVRPIAVGISVPAIVEAFDDADAGARIRAQAATGVEVLAERGAEVVIVASGALDVFLRSTGGAPGPVPVLPSVPILVQGLVDAASLARAGVPFVSRVGRFAIPPDEIGRSLRGGPSD